ncbi:hypothetical protein MFIFM68171_05016 [Madurella fahalii]|uniref:Uncharacterized protein n=1 Tax=Madurella fahalii TaxID=1157608 RepID=A0ABQ0GAK9_9PEZI
MCHGHPYSHSCGHQSLTWHYCPSAVIDLETGYETPCSHITFAASQPSTMSCPLANCDFRSAGGGWTCCNCGASNSGGWCTNVSANPKWEKNAVTNEWEWIGACDHGCCKKCPKDVPTRSDEPSRNHGKKGKDSQKHKQENPQEVSAEGGPVASYSITLDYSARDVDGSPRKQRGQKKRDHKRRN